MLTLLINLDRSTDRLRDSDVQLGKLGVDYRRVSATDGLLLNRADVRLYGDGTSWRRVGRELSDGEIACFLSHLRCLRLFVESPFQTCLVIEDDIDVADDAAKVLRETVGWLEHQSAGQVDLVHLSRSVRKIHRPVEAGNSTLNGAGLSYAPYLPMTTGAILWSQSGARAFLDATTSIVAPVDEALQTWCALRGRSYGFQSPRMRSRGS